MEIYYELLKEYGVPIDDSSSRSAIRTCSVEEQIKDAQIPQEELWQCCGKRNIDTDRNGESFYCYECGRCLRDRVIIYCPDYATTSHNSGFTNSGNSNYTSITFTRKRFYKPLTHFKEHLRRYMGARFTEIPTAVFQDLKIDAKDPEAYFVIKSHLKKNKNTLFYKEIFKILYILGGDVPKVSYETYMACIQDFKNIMYQFNHFKALWKRHSMPSMYMIMDILLRKNGHQPYYTIPYLKDKNLSQRVDDIYNFLYSKSINAQ